jgi:tetratricopeptide (TPR) repeat protein
VSCELQRFAEAVGHLTEALRLAEAMPGAETSEQIAHTMFLLGWAYHELHQHMRALEYLQMARDLAARCPQDTLDLGGQVALWKGYAYFHLGQYGEALRCLEEALRPGRVMDRGDRAVGQYYSAKCLYALGRQQEAVVFLRTILPSVDDPLALPDKYKADAYYVLGKAYYEQGNYADAIPWLEALVRSEPSLVREGYAECVLGVCLVEVDRVSEALRYLKHAYEMNPRDAFRTICFARALAAEGEYAQAIGLLEEFDAERDTTELPEDLFIQRCWLFAAVGDRPRYEANYEMLKTRFPKSRALSDPARTRWLPPPDALRWRTRDKR